MSDLADMRADLVRALAEDFGGDRALEHRIEAAGEWLSEYERLVMAATLRESGAEFQMAADLGMEPVINETAAKLMRNRADRIEGDKRWIGPNRLERKSIRAQLTGRTSPDMRSEEEQ